MFAIVRRFFRPPPPPCPRVEERAWAAAAAELPRQSLAVGEAHLWLTDTVAVEQQLGVPRSVLSESERERAESYTYSRERKGFVAAHAILRWILAQYLEVAPSAVRFSPDALGKPHLALELGADALEFSLSRSGEQIAVVVARGQQLGVDIENHRVGEDAEAFTAYAFSGREQGYLRDLPQARREAQIRRLWTVKEAALKAAGLGLSIGPEHCRVRTPLPDAAPFATEVEWGDDPSETWQVVSLDGPVGSCLAVATRSPLRTIQLIA